MWTRMATSAHIQHFNRFGVYGLHTHSCKMENRHQNVIKLSYYRNWFVSTLRAQRWSLTSLMCMQQQQQHHLTHTMYTKHDFSNNLQLHLNNLVGNFSCGSKSLKYFMKFECRDDFQLQRNRRRKKVSDFLLRTPKMERVWRVYANTVENRAKRVWEICSIASGCCTFCLFVCLFVPIFLVHRSYWNDGCEKVYDTPPILEVNQFKSFLNYSLTTILPYQN